MPPWWAGENSFQKYMCNNELRTKVAVHHKTVSVKTTHAANIHHHYAMQKVLVCFYLKKDWIQTSLAAKQEGTTDTFTCTHPHSHYHYMLFCKQ